MYEIMVYGSNCMRQLISRSLLQYPLAIHCGFAPQSIHHNWAATSSIIHETHTGNKACLINFHMMLFGFYLSYIISSWWIHATHLPMFFKFLLLTLRRTLLCQEHRRLPNRSGNLYNHFLSATKGINRSRLPEQDVRRFSTCYLK